MIILGTLETNKERYNCDYRVDVSSDFLSKDKDAIKDVWEAFWQQIAQGCKDDQPDALSQDRFPFPYPENEDSDGDIKKTGEMELSQRQKLWDNLLFYNKVISEKKEHMPDHGEIQSFASALAGGSDYGIRDESPPSRVVLLERMG